MIRLQKATKKKSKLRVMIEGAAGSGKTESALMLATAFGRVAVVDTENGSASLYADRYNFDVIELGPEYTPERYIEAINEVEQTGNYDVIILDGISNEWSGEGGCLDIHNKLGGRFQDFAKVIPRHKKFVESILRSPLHVIATCRSKADYQIDEKTKRVTKIGTAPEQRTDMDFEFSVVFSLNASHMAQATKDRTRLFDGKDHIITIETGKILINWLNSGAEPTPVEEPKKSTFIEQINIIRKRIGDERFLSELTKLGKTEIELSTMTDKTEQIKVYTTLNNLK